MVVYTFEARCWHFTVLSGLGALPPSCGIYTELQIHVEGQNFCGTILIVGFHCTRDTKRRTNDFRDVLQRNIPWLSPFNSKKHDSNPGLTGLIVFSNWMPYFSMLRWASANLTKASLAAAWGSRTPMTEKTSPNAETINAVNVDAQWEKCPLRFSPLWVCESSKKALSSRLVCSIRPAGKEKKNWTCELKHMTVSYSCAYYYDGEKKLYECK